MSCQRFAQLIRVYMRTAGHSTNGSISKLASLSTDCHEAALASPHQSKTSCPVKWKAMWEQADGDLKCEEEERRMEMMEQS